MTDFLKIFHKSCFQLNKHTFDIFFFFHCLIEFISIYNFIFYIVFAYIKNIILNSDSLQCYFLITWLPSEYFLFKNVTPKKLKKKLTMWTWFLNLKSKRTKFLKIKVQRLNCKFVKSTCRLMTYFNIYTTKYLLLKY